MASEIIDIGELIGEDKLVRLTKSGPVYRLPPDVPAELYLRIQKYARENPDADEAAVVEKLYEQALELFKYGDPKITSLPITVKQCMILIARVYGEQPDEADAAPPRVSRSGTAAKSGSRTAARKRSR